MFRDYQPVEKPLTLPDAMARALRFNLDRRAKVMEEALALGQLDVDRFDLLPKLTAGAGYVGRSDHATTTSRDSVTLQPALSNPSYSMDRDRRVADLTMSWNVLDFGVSWVSAQQNADRALMASERRRKAVAQLVQDVRYAYWRAAAAQRLEESLRATLAEATRGLADSRKVEAEGLKNPSESLRYQKSLLETIRQLEAIEHELGTAKAELAALINVPPNSEFRLANIEQADLKPLDWRMPVERMEELAFVNNPDLREQIYQGRVAADETRKAILKLLPGITFTGSRQHDSNSFLVSNYWSEASARLSFNLMNVFSAQSSIKYAEASQDLAEARRLALRMAVLAQVHVARQQFERAKQQFERSGDIYSVEKRLAATTQNRQSQDAQSVLERISSDTSAIAAELRLYQTYAQVQAALGRMEATIGVDPVPEALASNDLDSLSGAIAQRLAALDAGELPGETRPAAPIAPGGEPVSQKPPLQVVEALGSWFARGVEEAR